MQTAYAYTTRGLKGCYYWKTWSVQLTFSRCSQSPGFLFKKASTCVHICNDVHNINTISRYRYQTFSLPNCANLKKHTDLIKDASEHSDKHFTPSLHCVVHYTPQAPLLLTEGVVPGKGPPPDPPVDCCMSGCANCVWIGYAEALKDYYSDGGLSAKLAVEKIDNPSLKMFVKLELGLL